MHFDAWTFVLQTVNVLVLVWVLARFLFQPVAAIIADRRAATADLLAQAEATRAKAAQEEAELGRERAGIAEQAERIAAEAHAATETERARLLHEATEAITRAQAEAAVAIDHDREAMRDRLEQEASELAVNIAQRLLQRVSPHALTQAFLDTLAETLAAHPARDLLADEALELRSAAVLDGATQIECHAVLAKVLGTKPELTFRVDPALIAGLELIAPHAEIRLSWRADLDRINRLLLANHSHDTQTQHVA